MKLPITLLLLAALSQAFSVPVTKGSETKTNEANASEASTSSAKTAQAKNSAAKQEEQNETSKRELYEGNFGERTKDHVLKIEVSGTPPNNVYSKEMQEMVSEQTPAHQVFGVRLPQHTKISDVLSGHAPSFEAAVARQLYSPVSIYQTRISSPTTFEVPAPAASQSAYSNPEAYKQQNTADNEQKSQQVLPKSVELPRPPLALYRVNQPFDSHLQSLSSGLSRRQQNVPEESFQLQEVPRKQTPLLFPVYDQRGPFRHPGQFVPSQYLHQNGIFQIFPVGNNFGKGYQDGNNQDYSIENNYEQIKGERNLQIDFPVQKQPSYQSTIRPTSQKHDVVIQRQEIQEIFLEPPFQPASAPYDRNGQKLHLPYSVPELHQLRAQPHYQFFEQLLPYRHEMQDVHSPQEFIVEARQSQQNPSFAQQGKSRQYLIHQNSLPLQFQQFQPAQLQNLGLEQGQQQQPESNQAQQHQRALEQAQQRQQKAFELLQQHQESDQQQLQEAQHQQQTQQQQEELEQLQHQQQVEQQQETLEQAQQSELQKEALNQAQHQQQVEQQQEALEQAQHQQQAEQQQTLEQQKQELEQAQQLSQESEQVLKQQLQQNSLESNNQILISTLTPLENTEKQTETVDIQEQTESQTEQQDLKFQSTTGKPGEQPEHLPGPTSNLEQPYNGPYLTSSLNPQIYANHQLVPRPEQSPLLSVPAYTDVQYFGKFAQALFGSQH